MPPAHRRHRSDAAAARARGDRVPQPPPVQAVQLESYPSEGETPAAPARPRTPRSFRPEHGGHGRRAGGRRRRRRRARAAAPRALRCPRAPRGACSGRPARGPGARKDPPLHTAEPAASVQPTGTLAPGWSDRLGGTRAERGPRSARAEAAIAAEDRAWRPPRSESLHGQDRGGTLPGLAGRWLPLHRPGMVGSSGVGAGPRVGSPVTLWNVPCNHPAEQRLH